MEIRRQTRSNMDAANYKHIVLGLIFLKYISDTFEERQLELRRLFTTKSEDNIYYLPREDYNSDKEYEEDILSELEILEYYQEKNVFWVPPHSRWDFIMDCLAIPRGNIL